METQSFGVCFLIRKCKADKKRADIYVRITVDGEEKEFSTKEQIDISSWNSKKGIVKGSSIHIKSINDHLDNIRLTIKDKYRKLQDGAELITAQSVKDAYIGIQNSLKGHKLKELLKYYKEIWVRAPIKLTMSGRSKLTTGFAGEDFQFMYNGAIQN
ncbi:hypothetical protein DC498_20020 [Terrimonas sp.]|uniref:Arm DNA-binding domain-containing protein n=1 Tax=Terrimonas sp. TaxID=1914338 RepID=UPI000D517DEC|nr:Arm DNA-binding domain-containing protein [Terrimonas sp.]PVD50408.1 hypothetical protein DC498_20020 [Terrimonas sp.]